MTTANVVSVNPHLLDQLTAGIFDVDGVLLASPHEQAWRDALAGLADPQLFTTEIYQDHVAGKPRMIGALAALKAVGVSDAERHVAPYVARKQACLEQLIAAKDLSAFPDALRFVHAMDDLGWPMAAASSSKNANGMLKMVPFDERRSLFDVFVVNVCGRDLQRWSRNDIEVDSDGTEQRAVRFAIYHLNGAANPDDERVSEREEHC